MSTHRAIVDIDKKLLLNLLGFQGGKVIMARSDFELFDPDKIEIIIEHPDLPDVKPGSMYQHITPIYLDEVRLVDGKHFHNITRVEPPAS